MSEKLKSILSALAPHLRLDRLAGYRTYTAAAGLVGLAAYEASVGNYDAAFAALCMALTAVGLRGAKTAPPAAAACLGALGALLLLTGAPRAAEPVRALPFGDPVALVTIPVEPIPRRDVTDEVRAKAPTPDWGHGAIGVPDAWKRTMGEGLIAGVVDSGCDLKHPALAGQILAAASGVPGESIDDRDPVEHGTHVATIIAAREDSARPGVAPRAKLVVFKALARNGSGQGNWIATGIRYCKERGCKVINLSLGAPTEDPVIKAAIDEALAAGVTIVAAAGNEGPGQGTVGYPGGTAGVICVGAVGQGANGGLAVASFSSRGSRVDVAAPGVRIVAGKPGGGWQEMSGTSMASPYTTGVVTLALAAAKLDGRTLTPAEVRGLVVRTAKDMAPAGKDTATGAGLTQPAAMVAGGTTPPPVEPAPGRLVLTVEEFFSPRGRDLLKQLDKVARIEFVLKP